MEIEIKELNGRLWPDLEKLFGKNGACGGCWCMSWRIEKGERWDDVKGESAKERFHELVTSGKAHGLIAFVDGESVAWCSFDRRKDYKKLDRAPSLACQDAEAVWSVPCFFVKRGYRGRSIGSQLLQRAIQAVAARGGTIIEGYPSLPSKEGQRSADAFVWTGTVSMFEKAGFGRACQKQSGKIRMRKYIQDLAAKKN